ncbi:MAG: protein-glutamate O-methyltransferase [Spirochaetota bacterium]|nr:protein-glutamate O-methyltransferase [Spirochaetota bacterium]
MSDVEFKKFSDFIYTECGINLPPAKRIMLTARLNKRLRALGMNSFSDYYNYVLSPKGYDEELSCMIDVVTTNKTEFFREAAHFDYLVNYVLPELIESKRFRLTSRINIWCAGCSTGEEPYTLAIVLSEFFNSNKKGKFSILATDISTQVLGIARGAVYNEDTLRSVSDELKRKYIMRGKGSKEGACRIVPELRNCITFKRLNLMDKDFGIRTMMDIIFCRNVVIYFDRETQRELFRKFYSQLTPGGYLFIGNSETLHGINDQFESVAPTVYRKL